MIREWQFVVIVGRQESNRNRRIGSTVYVYRDSASPTEPLLQQKPRYKTRANANDFPKSTPKAEYPRFETQNTKMP